MNAAVSRLLIAVAAVVTICLLAAGYVLCHPGITFAETPLATAPVVTSFPQQGSFTVDPVHTCVGFDIGHLGLSRVQGRFSKLSGSLYADANNLDKSNVKITIDASSVDTAVAPRDADLRSPNFFDVTKYPEITFASTAIKKHGSSFIAAGDLTIKGVSKPVNIRFKQYGPIKDPWGNARIGVVAEPLVIHRSDFGMTFDANMISDDVTIRISLEATLNK
jgi:polyisoprenoid-binding protein YceI